MCEKLNLRPFPVSGWTSWRVSELASWRVEILTRPHAYPSTRRNAHSVKDSSWRYDLSCCYRG
ncbi:hypothetical protein HYR99_20880 [Candidatus Poribacteria bacterium]|nr:hypothetical protein [Candidatus Poribacteria bacterium]